MGCLGAIFLFIFSLISIASGTFGFLVKVFIIGFFICFVMTIIYKISNNENIFDKF